MGTHPLAVVASIFRYPVKGFSPERLTETRVHAGGTLPADRLYAIENGPGTFDPEAPRHLPKINFLMLMRDARLAAFETKFDEDTHLFEIRRQSQRLAAGHLNTPEGRRAIEAFLSNELQGELRGPPKIVSATGHSFSDVKEKCIHIINQASLQAVEAVVGETLHPLRFRPNLVLTDAGPWQEFEWVGERFSLGKLEIRVFKRTARCAAVNVDPITGTRAGDLPQTLRKTWGHSDFGVYALIENDGVLQQGAELHRI